MGGGFAVMKEKGLVLSFERNWGTFVGNTL